MDVSDCRIGTSVIYRGIIVHDITGFIIKLPYYPEYDKINLYVRIMTVCGNDIAVRIKRLEKIINLAHPYELLQYHYSPIRVKLCYPVPYFSV